MIETHKKASCAVVDYCSFYLGLLGLVLLSSV